MWENRITPPMTRATLLPWGWRGYGHIDILNEYEVIFLCNFNRNIAFFACAKSKGRMKIEHHTNHNNRSLSGRKAACPSAFHAVAAA